MRALSEDGLLGGRVVLAQPAEGYRIAIDPVVLAAAVRAAAGDKILELGSGVGAAALCLAARVADCTVTGVERDPELVSLMNENAVRNGVADRVTAHCGDVRAPLNEFAPGSWDHVMANPPFLAGGHATPPRDLRKLAATQEQGASLADWIASARRMLKRRGWLTLIHRADRFDALCAELRPGFGAITLAPLWPLAGRPAKRIIVRARKGVASPASVAPGLILHDPGGDFTPEAEAVLRDAAAL